MVEKEAFAILEGIKKNRHYLLGKKFQIRTNSRILSYLHEKREPKNKKLLNWALQLSEFDYSIEHISSKMNGISDCLSRLHEVNVIQDVPVLFDSREILAEQCNDVEISNATQYLRQGKRFFELSKLGKLKRYRKRLKLDNNGLLFWNDKVVLPKNLRDKAL